jgi:hypothetical protein
MDAPTDTHAITVVPPLPQLCNKAKIKQRTERNTHRHTRSTVHKYFWGTMLWRLLPAPCGCRLDNRYVLLGHDQQRQAGDHHGYAVLRWHRLKKYTNLTTVYS